MTSIATTAFAVLLAGCGSAATKHTAAPLANRNVPASRSAEQLLAAVDDLEATPHTQDHARVLAALQALADALTDLAPHRTSEILRIRSSGAALSRSVGNATAHADFVRIGLASAADAFRAIGPRGDRDRYGAALAAMVKAIETIDPERELLDEYPHVAASLRAAVRVVYAADSAAEPSIIARE